MSAEDAIARAKAIAARLAGTGATASLSASDPRTSSPPTPAPPANGDVNAVAEAALSAAFGNGASGSSSSGTKRKRWGTESASGTLETCVFHFQTFSCPSLTFLDSF